MVNYIKNIDTFHKNLILVFLATSLFNLFNLFYQLLIAHSLSPADFAAFNSLLSIFMIIAGPMSNLQRAVVKFTAEFNAHNQIDRVKALLSGLFKRMAAVAIITFFVFYFASFYIIGKLKIPSLYAGYLLAALLALSCVSPVFTGGVQGLELFKWLAVTSVASGVIKLMLAYVFILLGFGIAGALNALLAAVFLEFIISGFILRKYLFFHKRAENEVNFKEIFFYLLPVAMSFLCFNVLVSFDMVLVKYFFLSEESGLYSLAQMVGKIFLFMPSAISLVMFPKTASLSTKNKDTLSTLKRSLLYAAILCAICILFYNLFPEFVLKVLTGKVFAESVFLGRLFSISMSFFALLFIMISYFLSFNDLRFIKYLAISVMVQVMAIVLCHKSLAYVQGIICVNAILLFVIHLWLAFNQKNKKGFSR